MIVQRKYATLTAGATNIGIPMVKVGSNDFAINTDWTPVAGDVKVKIDAGAEANITNLPTYVNGEWEFVLTAAETTGKRVRVRVSDAATKVVEDTHFTIETFGHASAMWQFDPTEPNRFAALAIPNVAQGNAGQVPTADSTGRVTIIPTQTAAMLATALGGTRVLVVNAAAAGGGNGSAETPYNSLATAIAAAAAGDILLLFPGQYDLVAATLNLASVARLSLIGAGRDLVEIISTADLTTAGPIVRVGSDTRVKGVRIRGTAANTVRQACVGFDVSLGHAIANRFSVEDVHLEGDCGVWVRSTVAGMAASLQRYERVRVRAKSRGMSFGLSNGGGADVWTSLEVLILESDIWLQSATGVVALAGIHQGIHALSAQGIRAANCRRIRISAADNSAGNGEACVIRAAGFTSQIAFRNIGDFRTNGTTRTNADSGCTIWQAETSMQGATVVPGGHSAFFVGTLSTEWISEFGYTHSYLVDLLYPLTTNIDTNLSALLTRVGNPGGGSTDVAAQLALIVGYTDTLETNVGLLVTRIGTPSDNLAARIAAIDAMINPEIASILSLATGLDTNLTEVLARLGNPSPSTLTALITAARDAVDTEVAEILTRLGDPTPNTVTSQLAAIRGFIDTEIATLLSTTSGTDTNVSELLTRLGNPSPSTISALLALINGAVDTEVGTIGTGVASILTRLGDPNPDTLTSLAQAIKGFIDTEIAAILSLATGLDTNLVEALARIGNPSPSTLAALLSAVNAKTSQLVFAGGFVRASVGAMDANVIVGGTLDATATAAIATQANATLTAAHGAGSWQSGGGGGGGTDWSDEERKQIRYRLGIPGDFSVLDGGPIATAYPLGPGIYGAENIAEVFKAARTERVHAVLIGDSNMLQGGSGWDHGFASALDKINGLYGTGIFSAVPLGNPGWRASGAASGFGAMVGAPGGLDVLWHEVTGLTPRYAYLAAGTEPSGGIGSIAGTIQQDWPLVANELGAHFTYAKFPAGSGGSFQPGWRYAGPPYSPLAMGPVISTDNPGATYSLADATVLLPAGARVAPVEFRWGVPGVSADIAAPALMTCVQFDAPAIPSGWQVSTLGYHGGVSARQMLADLQACPPETLGEFFRQVRRRNGPAQRVLIGIIEGMNDRNENLASLINALLPGDGPAAFADNIEGIMDLINGIFDAHGWERPRYMLIPSHQISDPNDPKLSGYAQACRGIAEKRTDAAALIFSELIPYSQLLIGEGGVSYFDAGGPMHLVELGYERLADRAVRKIVATIDAPQAAAGGFSGPEPVTVNLLDADAVPVPGATFTVYTATGLVVGGAVAGTGTAQIGLAPGEYILTVSPTSGVVWESTPFEVLAGAGATVNAEGEARQFPAIVAPGLLNAWVVVRNTAGTPLVGKRVECVLEQGPGTPGSAYSPTIEVATSDGDGRALFQIPQGGHYKFRLGEAGPWYQFEAPDAPALDWAVTEFVGRKPRHT